MDVPKADIGIRCKVKGCNPKARRINENIRNELRFFLLNMKPTMSTFTAAGRNSNGRNSGKIGGLASAKDT